MRKRWNGSVQSSNAPVANQPGAFIPDYRVYRCMVTKVLFADDPLNISQKAQNPEVLYECVILGGYQAGQTLSNCRLAAWLGGDLNYSERTLTPSSKDLSKVRLNQHDGDVVYVQFNQGHEDYPIIIAAGKGITNKVAAKKADGPRSIEEFNGLLQEINNKGEFKITRKGGAYDSETKRFKPQADKFESKIEMIDGKIVIADENTTVTIDKASEKLTRVFKSGLSITEDGKGDKIEITTAGGAVATIDGKGKKVSIKAGSAEIEIDGNSGKISIKGEMVDLGSSTSDFVTKFTELASAFATHTHMVPQAPAGTLPSMPPMAPLLVSVGSQTVKVQS